MGDKRPRSKTGRTSSSQGLRDRQKAMSKAESVTTEAERAESVQNTIPWEVFTSPQILELLASSPVDVQEKLCTMLTLANTHVNLHNSIKVDLYLLAIHFCQQQAFPEIQCGAFITLFEAIIKNIQSGMSLLDNINFVSMLLTQQKDFKEGHMFDFYSTEQILAMTEYLKITVFSHYNLYKHSLNQQQEETIISLDKIIHVSSPLGSFDPPPLAEGISDHDIELYLYHAPTPEPVEIEMGEEGEEAGEAPAPGEEAPAPLIDMDNVKTVLDTMGNEMIDKFSKDIQNKCNEKEAQYLNRLGKVKKAID